MCQLAVLSPVTHSKYHRYDLCWRHLLMNRLRQMVMILRRLWGMYVKNSAGDFRIVNYPQLFLCLKIDFVFFFFVIIVVFIVHQIIDEF